MKVRVFNLLVYVLAIAFIIAGIIIFGQPVLLLLLLPFLILPALELPLFFRSVSKVSCSIYSKAEYVIIGNEVPVLFSYKNSSLYPFLQCNLKYYVNNLFYSDKKLGIISFAAMSKEKAESIIILESPDCGMVSLKTEEIMLTDLLGFFTCHIPFSFQVDVPVLPEAASFGPITLNTPSDGLDEYEESDLKGNLSSDVKEIREYRPGDRIQRIHWKLSAKLDGLFVKELAHTSSLSLVLLPELSKKDIKDTLSSLMGLSGILIREEERFEICLYHHTACEFKYLTINNNDSLIHAFYELYYLPVYESENSARECYYASAQKSASVIHIKGSRIEIIQSGQ